MKRIVTLLLTVSALLVSLSVQAASAFQNETLHYVISYKWGLVHKDAGEATLSLRRQGDNYRLSLAAKTKPWADKVYRTRDTLLASVRVKDFRPLSYEKITHEKGKYARDVITYSQSGQNTIGHAKRYREKKGKINTAESTLTASGPVYDMLSVFYYLRRLDYSQLNKNKIYTATVFSGNKKEKICIKSLGIEKIKLRDKSTREAYHIKFNFTQEGGKKSSDDIDTWISTDSSHIPLYLVGSLPVGQVRAYLVQ